MKFRKSILTHMNPDGLLTTDEARMLLAVVVNRTIQIKKEVPSAIVCSRIREDGKRVRITVELADRTIREEFVESTSSAKDMLDDDYINSLHNNGHIALHFPREEFSEEFIELKSTQIRRRCIEGRSINNYTVTGFLYKPDGSEEQVI